MRKLLLFTVILFGMICIKGLAAGCSAQVCICPNGGYVSYGEYCSPTYNNSSSSSTTYLIRAFAYDETSGAYGEGREANTDRKVAKKQAEKQALKNCRTSNCKIIASGISLVVSSPNGRLLSTNYKGIGTEREKAKTKLLNRCENMYGTTCKVLWDSEYGGFLHE